MLHKLVPAGSPVLPLPGARMSAMADDPNGDVEQYSDGYVMDELARLSQHTCDDVQSRIQAVYMWMKERKRQAERGRA